MGIAGAGRSRFGTLLLGLALASSVGAADERGDVKRPSLWMTVGTQRFAVTLEDNPTARAFVRMLPVTLDMSELNGNEKHGRLPGSLPTVPVRPGTLRSGDVMLYGNDTLVVFYETLASGYSYTRIGRIHESAGLARALGAGGARVAFTLP